LRPLAAAAPKQRVPHARIACFSKRMQNAALQDVSQSTPAVTRKQQLQLKAKAMHCCPKDFILIKLQLKPIVQRKVGKLRRQNQPSATAVAQKRE
jgi:hypothetical protein